MKRLLVFAVMCMVIFGASVHSVEGGQTEPSGNTPKILIAFFTRTNNTKAIAEHIHSFVGGDMFHFTTKRPYPEDYNETLQIARAELENNERPELVATISPEDMDKYDVIFLGHPIWFGTIPMAVSTFMEQYDLSGKTVVPFCTHGRGGPGRSVSDIADLCQNATILQGFAVEGSSANQAQNDVADWLRQLGYIR